MQEGGGSVGKAVLTRIVPSLELTIVTLLVSLPTAALLAVSAVRRGKRVVSKGAGQLLTVGFVLPQFWIAILLVHRLRGRARTGCRRAATTRSASRPRSTSSGC